MCTIKYKMKIIQENTKSYIIKKRLNNKILFVKFILYNWQFNVYPLSADQSTTVPVFRGFPNIMKLGNSRESNSNVQELGI